MAVSDMQSLKVVNKIMFSIFFNLIECPAKSFGTRGSKAEKDNVAFLIADKLIGVER